MKPKNSSKKRVIGAWAFYDWANSVYNLIITSAIFPIYYAAVTRGNKAMINGQEVDVVSFFGRQFVNSELLTYVISFSFLIVVLMVPLLSGIADYTGTKKRFLQFFCYLGAAACVSLYWFDVNHLERSMLSVFVASIGFWGSLVYYNSFLPEIAPKQLHDKISARGFSLGYVGSVLLLIFVLIMNQKYGRDIREAFLLVGIWWAGFAQYTYYHLPSRTATAAKVTKAVVLNGYKEIRKVWNELKKIRIIKGYLLSYFVYNMGVQTIMILAVVFAEKEIDWPLLENGQKDSSGLIISIIIIQIIAVFGATIMSRMSRSYGNIKVLMIAVLIWISVTVAAYFIHSPIEFYFLAAVVGFVMGGIQALSRSTYSKMIPKTPDTASYFSFYDIMEKIGLIIGPFLFGLIEGLTGNMRLSVLLLMFIFVVGFILLLRLQRIAKQENLLKKRVA
ncbi:MAG: MFS transporter [Bacteroidia bacterium]